MPNSTSIPIGDARKLELLQQLDNQLPNYSVALEISPDDLSQISISSIWFDYSLKAQIAAKNYANALFAFKRALRDGPKSATLNLPSAPVLPNTPSSPANTDIFGFLGALITRIKKHKNYTESIGKALGIIAAQTPSIDPTTLQPILSADFQGGHPVLHWKSNSTDALEIEADHGTGIFSLLTIKMSPGYQDNTPLPASGIVTLWRYRAIYHIHDEQVGQWSQVLEIGVKN